MTQHDAEQKIRSFVELLKECQNDWEMLLVLNEDARWLSVNEFVSLTETERASRALETVREMLDDHGSCGPGECNVLEGIREFLGVS